MNSLAVARSVSGLAAGPSSRSVPARRLSHREPRYQPVGNYATEDPMEVDHPQASGSGEPSTPLARVWANRASRREREDEDLVSEPGSPGPSGDEEEPEGDGDPSADELELLSDDEAPLVHIEISAAEQLTADFQIHSAKAGMLFTAATC